jgi:hypothetical protein
MIVASAIQEAGSDDSPFPDDAGTVVPTFAVGQSSVSQPTESAVAKSAVAAEPA